MSRTRAEPPAGALGDVLRRHDVAAVAAASALTLALVVPWLTRRPFWFDELVSLEIADLRSTALLDYLWGVEANMALYHLALAGWATLWDGEAAVRSLSVLFALATLPFVYALGRRLFDRRTATVAVVLTSVNVSFVGHARDARGYALALLLVTASWLFLVNAVVSGRRRDWALYAVAGGLCVWAHLLAGLVVASQVAWVILERRRTSLRRALPAFVALGAVALPVVLAVIVGGQRAQLDWLERPRPTQLPGLLEWFVESRITLALYAVGAMLALIAAFDEWRATRRVPSATSLLLLWLLVPATVAFALSYLDPVYLDRYFLVSLPALVLLVSAGLAGLRPAWLGMALAVAAVVVSVRTVVSCQPDCKIRHDDWEGAAAWLGDRARPGDAVVVYPPEVRTALDHYLDERRRPDLLYPARWGLGATRITPADRDELGSALDRAADYRRVWLVTWWLPAEQAREALERRATLVDEREFAGNVHLDVYRPVP